jgi:hypothetical protein
VTNRRQHRKGSVYSIDLEIEIVIQERGEDRRTDMDLISGT